MIFLMGLLCLVSNGELFSQHCFTMSYDKNGNRITFNAKDCSKDLRGGAVKDDSVDERYEESGCDLLAYPNPSNGRFRIEFKNDDNESCAEVLVYDNKGVLIDSREFAGEVDMDISDSPAGVYMLRIIRDDEEISMIMVKL